MAILVVPVEHSKTGVKIVQVSGKLIAACGACPSEYGLNSRGGSVWQCSSCGKEFGVDIRNGRESYLLFWQDGKRVSHYITAWICNWTGRGMKGMRLALMQDGVDIA